MSEFLKSREDEACLTLTVNSRLARRLLFEHNEKQMASGLRVWSTPAIFPLTDWLQQAWVQSWPGKYILADLQSHRLWEEIVQQDPRQTIQDILHLSETAKIAAEAHALIQKYRLPTSKETFSSTEESRAFYKWLARYENRLARMNALDPASAMDEVDKAMRQGDISIPGKIAFAGFEEITPQFQTWLDFLEDRGTSIRFHPEIQSGAPSSLKSLTSGKTIVVREFTDKKNEAVHCARWVRANYRPGKKIGVVAVDLQSYRSLLKRELSAELAPGSVFPGVDKAPPFNISLGPTLWEEPMVNIAAQILSIQESAVPLRTFTAALGSLCLNVGFPPSLDIHKLESKLFKGKTLTVHLSAIEASIPPGKSAGLTDLLSGWRNLTEQKGKRSPSQWGIVFTNILKVMGWPSAGRTLTGRERQVYEAWKDGLDEFAALDAVLGEVHRRRAVEVLTSMVKERPFQEKTREQPIQVVGLLESSGMRFDRLWVAGCSAEALPAPPSPNPFLPIEIRKSRNLPHSTAQRELEFAENSLRRLLNSSTNIVFSYPVRDKNIELKMSPLIASLGAQTDASEFISHRVKDQFQPDLRVFKESSILPVGESEKKFFEETGPGGGYRFLKDQAECPFRSFANHRLNTQREEFPELDFDHQERGVLVHKALEIFWRQTRTHAALLKLQREDRLEKMVENAVQTALKKYESKFSRQNLFCQLELQRVRRLTLDWLNEEMQRSPFEVVDLEKEDELKISGLKIRLRIDRIDKTEDGKIALIDYKTGAKVDCAKWFEERIQEPQLPLYAFHTSPDAVAFAQVKKGSHKLKGASDPSFLDSGFTPVDPKKYSDASAWKEQLEYWRTRLTEMADEFLSGRTQVDPIKGPDTCRHCDLQTLCRIREMSQGWMEDAE